MRWDTPPSDIEKLRVIRFNNYRYVRSILLDLRFYISDDRKGKVIIENVNNCVLFNMYDLWKKCK